MLVRINREQLVPATNLIGGVVEKRQTLPILGNILVQCSNDEIELVATDLEIEIKTRTPASADGEGEFTLPAKKFIDICKALPEGADIDISIKGDRANITSNKSRFRLSVLPPTDYPNIEVQSPDYSFTIQEGELKTLIEKTAFSMAQQDVRYYLNGMLFEFTGNNIRTVATDGHRLALSDLSLDIANVFNEEDTQVLLPRKAVVELGRLLDYSESPVEVELSSSYARFKFANTFFTTKLIDGKFPDYQRVIPKHTDKTAMIEKEVFKRALIRSSILSSEKYKGIRLSFDEGLLHLQAHNPEQEEAEEEMQIDYQETETINIGFNVGYLLDILNVIDTDQVQVQLADGSSSAVIKQPESDSHMYVIMPMRL